MSNLTLHEVTIREELDDIVVVNWAAFHNPYRPEYHLYHPVFGPSPADRNAAIKADQDEFWGRHNSSAASHWIYVKDEATGEVLGGAQWLIHMENPYPNGPKRLVADWWPEGDGRDIASEALNQSVRPRMYWMQKPHVAINTLSTHPSHRARGVGTLLMQWGIQIADELGFECFVESTDEAKRLYERFGFRALLSLAINVHRSDASDAWRAYAAQFGRPSFWAMWRPRNGELREGEATAPWKT